MGKDKDFFDDLYKMLDPLGFHDRDKDGHYDADERFSVDWEEQYMIDQMNKKGPTSSFDDDDLDDDDLEYEDDMEPDEDYLDDDDDDFSVGHGSFARTSKATDEDDDDYEDEDDIITASSEPYVKVEGSVPQPDATGLIKRDLEHEKRDDILDLNFYCYTSAFDHDIYIVIGEVVAKSPLRGPFAFRANIYDSDDDLIDTIENRDYQANGGIVERRIMPEIFFNRHPFAFEIPKDYFKRYKVCIIPDMDEVEEEYDNKDIGKPVGSLSHLNINKILAVQPQEAPVHIPNIKVGDKLPKGIVYQYIENFTGLESLKFVFIKNDFNQLKYTMEASGHPKEKMTVYMLFYNEKNQLITWELVDIMANSYKSAEKGYINLPSAARLGRIIIYPTLHTINCMGTRYNLRELKKNLIEK